jgi:hypothetical protein
VDGRLLVNRTATPPQGWLECLRINGWLPSECLWVQRGPATPAATSARMRGVALVSLVTDGVAEQRENAGIKEWRRKAT